MMTDQICIKCKLNKEISEYTYRKDRDTYKTTCKVCLNAYVKKWTSENKERKKLTDKLWAQRNPEKVKAKSERYENSIKGKVYRKEYQSSEVGLKNVRARVSKYRAKPESKHKINEYVKNRRNTDPIFNLKDNIRRRINETLAKNDFTKSKNTIDCIGCSWEELQLHLEKQFKPGMSWENREDWHVDHIKPISLATTEEEVYELNHFTNLQPLWAEDNLKKSDNY
jgi:hypothetical protein